jgi:hypothetical protein
VVSDIYGRRVIRALLRLHVAPAWATRRVVLFWCNPSALSTMTGRASKTPSEMSRTAAGRDAN